jgi:hypothetical protein
MRWGGTLRPYAESLQLFYTHGIHLYTVLTCLSLPCNRVFPTGVNEMDWLYLLLIAAFFGLSVLLVYGIEKMGRPS